MVSASASSVQALSNYERPFDKLRTNGCGQDARAPNGASDQVDTGSAVGRLVDPVGVADVT